MAPSIQYSLANESAGTSNTFSVAGGAGIAAGDLLLICIRTADDRTVTAPSGWTIEEEIPNSQSGGCTAFLSRTANGTENGTSITTTLNLTSNAVGGLVAITGGSFDTYDTADATDVAPTVTAAANDTLELQFLTEEHADSPTLPSAPPVGLTQLIKNLYSGETTADPKLMIGYRTVNAGSTGGDDWGPVGWDLQTTIITYLAGPQTSRLKTMTGYGR